MQCTKAHKRTGKISSYNVGFQRKDSEMYAWAKPYNDPNIEDVYTGLGGNFKYSPIFKNSIADTMVALTGYRNKDYVIAEAQVGKKHTPCVTVWHHAWQEKNGLYRMQLVDFDTHKKTCPHAGGCKLWLLNTKKKSKYNSYRRSDKGGDYTDITTYYSIQASDRNYYQRGYVSKRTLSCIRRKKLKLVGIDIYGNLIYESRKGKYFWDHESDCLMSLGH